MKNSFLIPIGLLIIIFGSFFLTFYDVNHNELLTNEDGFFETIGALAFLCASILFIICWYQSKGKGNEFRGIKTNRNIIFLGCGLLFFVAFGEEISWGQRIFNWETPEAIEKINFQQETNLHNLDGLNINLGENYDGIIGRLLVINPGRIFFYFWFTLMIIIPLLNKYSLSIRNSFQRLRVPIAPLWLGALMISNLIIAKVFIKATASYPIETFSSIDEIMETNYALIIAILAIYWTRKFSYSNKANDANSIKNSVISPYETAK